MQLQPERICDITQAARLELPVSGVGRIDQQRHDSCRRHQFVQQVEALSRQLGANEATPVTLPLGRLRLATRPSWTGSPRLKMIGIVMVAALAANAIGAPPTAKITLTCRRTRSATKSGARLYWLSAQRYSIATFSPST